MKINWVLASVVSVALVYSVTPRTQAGEPRKSGLSELVVLDPGTHELGLPAVRLESVGDEKHMTVDIPPTVHVHRFYYSGDKEFQGPILQGGPTVVVANHPKTGERMYVDVNLPSGAPVIAHSKSAISYIYPDRRVTVKFSRLKATHVSVYQKSGRGGFRNSRDKLNAIKSATHNQIHNSQLLQNLKEGTSDGKNLLFGVTGAVDQAAGSAFKLAKTALGAVPGISTLQNFGEQRLERAAKSEVGRKAAELQSTIGGTIPTIR